MLSEILLFFLWLRVLPFVVFCFLVCTWVCKQCQISVRAFLIEASKEQTNHVPTVPPPALYVTFPGAPWSS